MLVGGLIESEKEEHSALIQSGRIQIIEEIRNVMPKKELL